MSDWDAPSMLFFMFYFILHSILCIISEIEFYFKNTKLFIESHFGEFDFHITQRIFVHLFSALQRNALFSVLTKNQTQIQ